MEIKVLAFGIAKDIFGAQQLTVTLGNNATVADMKGQLERQYPRLAQLSSYMVAVDNEYADNTVALCEGHEIAIIPPVSGG